MTVIEVVVMAEVMVVVMVVFVMRGGMVLGMTGCGGTDGSWH